MSEPYDEPKFLCERCGEYFIKEEMIEEDNEIYCKNCYEILLREEGL